jgi:membrane-associated HD superfamily phosphohydrolase
MTFAPVVVFVFLIMHLLICAWIRFDARSRMINEHRWYLFSLFLPVFGIIYYASIKKSWKAWILFFSLWVFPALVIVAVKLLLV